LIQRGVQREQRARRQSLRGRHRQRAARGGQRRQHREHDQHAVACRLEGAGRAPPDAEAAAAVDLALLEDGARDEREIGAEDGGCEPRARRAVGRRDEEHGRERSANATPAAAAAAATGGTPANSCAAARARANLSAL